MNPAQRGLIRGLIIVAAVLLVALAGLTAYRWLGGRADDNGAGIGQVTIGGPFELTNQDGKTVTDKDFAGKLMLVYFGYTNCPDICPTGLQNIALAMDALGASGEQVQPILITVDPERDTPAVLKEYVGAFHKRLIGLTGTPEQIAKVAKEYRVYYQKAPLKNSSLGYAVDHSGFIYLMDRKGRYLAHLRHDSTPEQIAERIRSKL